MAQVQQIEIRTSKREEMIDITSLVRGAIKKTGVSAGVAYVYVPHTTAAVTLQENTDPTVKTDLLGLLARLIPKDGGFEHAEGNADAHIKSSAVGASQTIPVEGGRLLLGTWQAIWFCEFDGPRSRRVLVKVLDG
ncbi:MAG TPA: secondary thiamine-phosphate synthase enzyme YjbQ [Polyangia bacterium]|nr:secondary thiamine-phosphate synthase enzyme YjbQ [Polyangia bacterium]